jgi:hypothetical protein
MPDGTEPQMNRSGALYRWCHILAVLFVCMLPAACEKPPTDEMIKAERFIEDAERSGAAVLAPDTFGKAQEALRRAKAEVAQKRYREAEKAAEEALRLSRESLALTESRKDTMKREAEQKMQQLLAAIAEMRVLADGEGSTRLPAGGRDEVLARLEAWEAEIAMLRMSFEKKDILQVVPALENLERRVGSEKTELSAASARIKKKRRGK